LVKKKPKKKPEVNKKTKKKRKVKDKKNHRENKNTMVYCVGLFGVVIGFWVRLTLGCF
jgi:hypothetical protein